MYGIKSPISAIAVHPRTEVIAVASEDGLIVIYDYMDNFAIKSINNIPMEGKKDEKQSAFPKKPMNKSQMTPEQRAAEKEYREKNRVVSCMEFTPEGELLIGTTRSEIKIIEETEDNKYKLKKLSQELLTSDQSRKDVVKQLVVTDDGKYFATSDSRNCVSLFKHGNMNEDENGEDAWFFTGKIMSHQVEITSICFGKNQDDEQPDSHRLFSIGRDRRCFEYDVAAARLNEKLPVIRVFDIELEAHPTACIWYPGVEPLNEGWLLTANDEYKMKLWNPTTTHSRRTCLGPTYGGEITKMKLLGTTNGEGKDKNDDKERYLLYSTSNKVIGLIQLPLDGNPQKTMGLIAHPDDVQDICCSADGKYVFTCGGDDLAVNMWSVDVNPINQAIALGGEGIEPFIRLIEGGQQGQTFQDMNDFFYYSMIRSKKENTTRTRKLEGFVPVDELPNLMRAMGYYPTNQEINNMKSEVRFRTYPELGEPNNRVTLDEFIKLFVNHRPVYGIGKNNIEDAFKTIIEQVGDSNFSEGIYGKDFIDLLTSQGEEISHEEL